MRVVYPLREIFVVVMLGALCLLPLTNFALSHTDLSASLDHVATHMEQELVADHGVHDDDHHHEHAGDEPMDHHLGSDCAKHVHHSGDQNHWPGMSLGRIHLATPLFVDIPFSARGDVPLAVLQSLPDRPPRIVSLS